MAGEKGTPRSVITAFVANLAIAAAKFVAFAFTGSAAMLAEGIHSVADTSNQALLLVGRRRSRKEATADHPFGYGQEAYFWAFLVAIVLFTLGALFSLVEGYRKLRHPHTVEALGWAIAVLVFSVGAEGVSMRSAVRHSRSERHAGWWRYVHETRTPENVVVLLEDTAAEIGLAAALAGVTLAALTGDARFDALGSVIIGAVLAVVAIVLAVEMRSLLIGESANPGDIATICALIERAPPVERVIDLRTMHLGPEDILVTARVELDGGLDADGTAAWIDKIESAIRKAVPAARRIYIEPDHGVTSSAD